VLTYVLPDLKHTTSEKSGEQEKLLKNMRSSSQQSEARYDKDDQKAELGFKFKWKFLGIQVSLVQGQIPRKRYNS